MQRSRSRKLAGTRVLRATPRATTLLRHAPIAAAIMAAMHTARAQEGTTALEEVVVTAEKRAENLQDVPISITAMDTKKLEELNLQHFTDYAQALPTVAFQTFEPGFSNLYMRGIVGDANTNHSGPLPSVGTYLDEQPITTIQGSLDLHIYDIARIEVLPGPQGTLYGASSEAGTLRIITNKPDPSGFKAGYDLQANTLRNGTAGGIAEGFVNLPLSSKAALRLVHGEEVVMERQPRRMVGDAPDRRRGRVPHVRGYAGVPQVVIHRAVEIHFAGLDQGHEGGGGKGLGDRGQRVQSVLVGRDAPGAIRPAETLFPNNLAVFGDCHCEGRRAAVDKLPADGLSGMVELAACR